LLSNPEILPWFGPSVPFWAAAVLCGVNVLLVFAMFKETLKEKSDKAVNAFAGFRNLRLGFSMPNLRSLFMVGFLATFGFSFFTQFFSVYMIQAFSFEEKDLGLMFGYMGICIAFVQGGLMRVVGKKLAPAKIVVMMLLLLSLAIPAVVLPGQVWGVMLVLLFVAVFHGLSQPNLNALVSEQAEQGQQGMIMGINQSMASFGNAMPPLLGGFLGSIDATIPLLAGGLSTLIAWLVFQSFYRRKTVVQG
jgi:DHA1 family tetracycline resistance protein-like MFS transporter